MSIFYMLIVGTLGAILFLRRYLFWLWLWQIKEYHWGRMRAHLKTRKGMRQLLIPFKKSCFLPKMTAKVTLLVLTGALFILLSFLATSFSPIAFLLVYLLAPAVASFFVVSLQPFVHLWQKLLIARATKKRRKMENLVVIGVTGSYGKSTTKEFLSQLLSSRFKVLKTPRNINSEVGIARLILDSLDTSHEVFICEIGAYEKGKVREVSEMIKPQVGILTGINEQHLATFGSQENIVEGKFELLNSLSEEGVAVVNWDNTLVRSRAVRFGGKTIKCSLEARSSLWVERMDIGKDHLNLVVKSGQEEVKVKLKTLGRQSTMNFLLAAGAAMELGLSLQEVASKAESIRSPDSGMKTKKGKRGVIVIDDSYSANPHGVKAALEYLYLYKGKRVIVMPCLIELGTASDRVHERIGKIVGDVCDKAVITDRDCFDKIKEGASDFENDDEKVVLAENPERACDHLKPFLKKNTAILLESRVPDKIKSYVLE